MSGSITSTQIQTTDSGTGNPTAMPDSPIDELLCATVYSADMKIVHGAETFLLTYANPQASSRPFQNSSPTKYISSLSQTKKVPSSAEIRNMGPAKFLDYRMERRAYIVDLAIFGACIAAGPTSRSPTVRCGSWLTPPIP